jgi:hypothetical protein
MAYHSSDEIPNLNIWVLVRDRRKARLDGTDWTQAADSPLSDSKKAEWATYRQTLRDLPATHDGETDITKIVFPDEPS